ncbi:hypothetical protein MKX01_020417 [Papaver californicum]|nr:hypothetical protein MKX01_020417 [Papaver californicum]
MASKLLLVLVFILDLIAFGLAVAAEQRRRTAIVVQDKDKNYDYCVYDSDISTGLGVGSFFRCFCCGKSLRPGGARAWAILLFIACWATFFIAEICLLAGSVRNAYHTKYRNHFAVENYSCNTVRKGVFGAGAAFIVFTGILTEIYYVCYARAKDGFQAPYGRDAGVGMGTYS